MNLSKTIVWIKQDPRKSGLWHLFPPWNLSGQAKFGQRPIQIALGFMLPSSKCLRYRTLHIRTFTYVYMYTCRYIYIYICIYIHTHICIRSSINGSECRHILNAHTRMFIYQLYQSNNDNTHISTTTHHVQMYVYCVHTSWTLHVLHAHMYGHALSYNDTYQQRHYMYACLVYSGDAGSLLNSWP